MPSKKPAAKKKKKATAKKRTTSKKKPAVASAGGKEDEGISVSISIRTTENTASYYVNHIEIAHNQHEFALLCGKVPTAPPPELLLEVKKSGTLSIEAEAQVIVPPTLMEGLIKALKAQQEKYERAHGKILKK